MKVGTIIKNLEKPSKIILKRYHNDRPCFQKEKVHNSNFTFLFFASDKVLDCRKISDKHYEIICRGKC